MADKEISQAVISRLPRYFRYLGDLREKGVERISSQELSDIMKVTASQIRQDFNNFGGFGQQGYGYNIDSLRKEIGQILGTYRDYSAILVGPGHLGTALVENFKFIIDGYSFLGSFDVRPEKIGSTVGGYPIYDIATLGDRVVESFSGSFTNIMGLPAERVGPWLSGHGLLP